MFIYFHLLLMFSIVCLHSFHIFVVFHELLFMQTFTLMAVSSSRIFPLDEESISRILSSISFSCFLFFADSKISSFFFSSSSGFSLFGGSLKLCHTEHFMHVVKHDQYTQTVSVRVRQSEAISCLP